MNRRRNLSIRFGALVLLAACAHSAPDSAWYSIPSAAPPRPMAYQSRYLTMRDGVRIALDLHLPGDAASGERFPAILHQTRYFRSVELRWLGRVLIGDPFDHTPLHRQTREELVSHGYAWIDIDVRGSGASEGTQLCPYAPEEIRDAAQVVDWIVAQAWSDGKVGSLGLSYDGTATDFLLVNSHPAVKATAPLFAGFDTYEDLLFPGGVRLSWFTEAWGRSNAALDRDDLGAVAGWWVNLFVRGVKPVDGAADAELAAALHAHEANYDVDAGARELTYRDDISRFDPFYKGGARVGLAGHAPRVIGTIGVFSPHSYVDDLAASGAAIQGMSGWFDGAYAHGAIKRYLSVRTPGSRLILGPWSHGGGSNIGPPDGPRASAFDHAVELRRFFDWRLRGMDDGISAEPPIHYFTMAEGKWKSADTWPVPATLVKFYLGAANSLGRAPPAGEGSDTYRVDDTAGTGSQSRWNTLVGGDPVAYPDRAEADQKLLVYTSAPLEQDLEVTGHPLVELFVASTADDGAFFVYLEDVGEDGGVTYVTEGVLRALHRKLSDRARPYADVVPFRTFERADAQPLVPGETAELAFDLQPTSYLFRRGHSIRIALAGADAGHFAPVLTGAPPILTVQRSAIAPSAVVLPVVARP